MIKRPLPKSRKSAHCRLASWRFNQPVPDGGICGPPGRGVQGFMISRKALKGASYNIGHSFVSLMNDPIDELLFSEARRLNTKRISINLLTCEVYPREVNNERLLQSIGHYSEWFPKMVVSNGSSMEYVKKAVMNIYFRPEDLENNEIELYEAKLTVKTVITDDKGKQFVGLCKDFR
jgi:hypothetical protein